MQKDLPTGAAVGIGLMLILPLLNYLRDPPIADFYGEWLSAVSFAVAALFLVPLVKRKADVSAALLLAPLALGAVLLIQALSGVIDYAYDWITWSSYLTLLVLAFLLGQALRGNGLEGELTSRLAYALVLAGVVNFAIQLIQIAGLAKGQTPYVVPLSADACRTYGNIGQANQATLLAWMSIMAALYLHGVGRMRAWATAVLVPCMLLASALTTSRMAWLFLLLAIVTVVALKAWPARSTARRWVLAALLGIGFLAATLSAAVLLESISDSCVTALGRFTNTSGVGYVMRLELWRQTIEIWLSSPWLGAGAGLFMAKAYLVQPLGAHQPLDYYAHNVWLQILAEFGVFAAAAVGVTVVWWAIALFRHRDGLASPDSILLYWLGVLGMHSALEFPLYYVHFLLLFGLSAGLLIRPNWTPPAVALPLRALVATITVAVAAGCIAALVDYRRLDRVSHMVTVLMANNFGATSEIDDMVEAARQDVVLYRPMADHAVGMLTPLTEDRLEQKTEATQRLVDKSPTSLTVLRRIALALLAEDDATALWHAQRLVMFYPHSAPGLFRELERHFEKRADLQERVRQLGEQVLKSAPPPRW
jgi:O-antigen ligase